MDSLGTVLSPRMTPSQVALMLRYVLRMKNLYTIATSALKIEHFSKDSETAHATLWYIAKQVFDALPEKNLLDDLSHNQQLLVTDLYARMEIAATPEERTRLESLALNGGILAFVLDPNATLVPQQGIQLLRMFLTERAGFDSLAALATAGDQNHIPADFQTRLNEINQLTTSISALGANFSRCVEPQDYCSPTEPTTSTGIETFDQCMDGGTLPGEVYAVLGCTGGGKTVLATQLACEKARQLQSKHQANPNTLPGKAFMFFYEANFDEMRGRVRSHTGRVAFSRSRLRDWQLSRTGQLEPYEKALFAQEIARYGIANVPGEFERIQATQALRRDYMCLADCNGSGRPGQGSGGVAEIVNQLEEHHANGHEIGVVTIDYAGLCVSRYMAAQNKPVEQLRRHLAEFCDEVKTRIAERFRCPVWVFHQLNGACDTRHFDSSMHHSEARDCKTFAENTWFAFCLGKVYATTGVLKLFCTKSRRARNVDVPPLLCLQGNIQRFDSSDEYVIDSFGLPALKSDMTIKPLPSAKLRNLL